MNTEPDTESVAAPAAPPSWAYPPFVPPVTPLDTETVPESADADDEEYVPVVPIDEQKAADAREARRAKQEKKRREAGMKPRVLAACGTPAAYRRHLRNSEPVDDLCRTEWNKAARDRRAKAKEAAAAKAAVEAEAREQQERRAARAANAFDAGALTPTDPALLTNVFADFPSVDMTVTPLDGVGVPITEEAMAFTGGTSLPVEEV